MLIVVGWLCLPIALLFGLALLKVGIYSWRFIPPPQVQTFDAFLLAMPEPSGAFLRDHDGGEYLVLIGDTDGWRLVTFPSGDPEYVFDRSGRLVDWTADSGDDEAYNVRWAGSRGRSRPIAMDAARRWIQPQDPAPVP